MFKTDCVTTLTIAEALRAYFAGPTPEQEFEDILERTRYISEEAFAFNRDAAFRNKPGELTHAKPS